VSHRAVVDAPVQSHNSQCLQPLKRSPPAPAAIGMRLAY
jgi:hypothetical protein